MLCQALRGSHDKQARQADHQTSQSCCARAPRIGSTALTQTGWPMHMAAANIMNPENDGNTESKAEHCSAPALSLASNSGPGGTS